MCCFRCSGVLVEPDFSPSAHPDHMGLALGSAWSSQECREPSHPLNRESCRLPGSRDATQSGPAGSAQGGVLLLPQPTLAPAIQ